MMLSRGSHSTPAPQRTPPEASYRYLLGVAAVIAALAVSMVASGIVALAVYVFFFAAVVLTAWYGGRGPAVLATALSGVLANYFLLEPRYSWSISSADVIRTTAFAAVSLLIAAMRESLETARREADLRAEEAAEARDQVEDQAAMLQEQAAELELQAEEAQVLTEELEATNAELSQAAQAAENERARVAQVLDAMSDSYLALDSAWRIAAMNRAAELTHGKPAAKVVGGTLWEEWPGFRGTEVERQCRAALEEQAPAHFEHHYTGAGQLDVWLAIDAYPHSGGLSLFFRDISDRKRAEAAIRARVLQTGLAASIGTAVTRSGSLDDMLSACAEALANHLDAAATRIWTLERGASEMRLHAQAGAAAPPPGPDVAQLGSPGAGKIGMDRTPELANEVTRDGDHIDPEWAHRAEVVSYAGYPLVVEDQLLGVVEIYGRTQLRVEVLEALRSAADGIALGISRERAEAERELFLLREREARGEAEAANRAKGLFLATMSHEIRTPINAIVGYTDLLEMGLGGPLSEGQTDFIERIKASGRHLLGLVNDVLDLSKLDAGGMTAAARPSPLSTAVTEALVTVAPQADAKRTQIARAEGCSPDAAYMGDPDRVRQILINLLSNAVKFTPAGGRINVACRMVDDPAAGPQTGAGPWAVVEVADTGIGVAPEQIERIFDPFVQVDDSHTRSQGGTGLGLTISRRFARLMGGDLVARSAEGEGSVFTLWLPAAAAAPAAEADVLATGSTGTWQTSGLSAVGHVLSQNVDPLVARFGERLATDPGTPSAHTMDQVDREDHFATSTLEIGKALVALDEGGGDAALLSDIAEIQRIVASRHGQQRLRFGWSAVELERETEILFEQIKVLLQREARSANLGDLAPSLDVIRSLLHRALRIALDTHAAASPREPAGSTAG